MFFLFSLWLYFEVFCIHLSRRVKNNRAFIMNHFSLELSRIE